MKASCPEMLLEMMGRDEPLQDVIDYTKAEVSSGQTAPLPAINSFPMAVEDSGQSAGHSIF